MCDDFKRKLADLDDLDENFIANKPWAQNLLESSLKMTKKAVLNWCNTICKIGEAEVELEEYISIFLNEIQKLYIEMITDVDAIEQKTLEKITNSLQQLESLCRQLHIEIPNFTYEDVPLCELYKHVRARIADYETLVEIRKREWQELHHKQMKLCKNLGRDPLILSEFPTPKEIDELRAYVEDLETAAIEREEKFFQLKEEIVEIAAELGSVPSLDFEREILNLTNSEVRISDHDMEALEQYRDRLVKQKESVKEEISELRHIIDSLWDKLETNIGERDSFRQKTTGNTLETLKVLQEEVQRLDEIKKANIKAFICKQRQQLVQLWEQCHCTDAERQAFRFYNSECYNEDLFELHEREIEKWKTYHDDNKDMFAVLAEYKNLWRDRVKLETNEGGTNRYKNRGGQLLREEKQRNKLKKRMPQLERELRDRAELHFARTGRHFLSFGQTIDEVIDKLQDDAEQEVKLKMSAKKLQREQASTVGGSRMNLNAVTLTPSVHGKRKIRSPVTEPVKKSKVASRSKAHAQTGRPKLNVSINRRRSARRDKLRQKLSFHSQESNKENATRTEINYNEFEEEVSTKFQCRSTGFVLKDATLKVPPTTPKKTENDRFLAPGVSYLPFTPRRNV